jgi:hypothetical protein
MVRWLELLLGHGETNDRRIVDTGSLDETWTPQVSIRTASPEVRAYGLGWYLSSWKGHPVRWHQGGGLGFTSQIRVFPLEGVAVAVLCNRMASAVPDLAATRAAELLLGEPHEELLDRAVQLTARIDAYRSAAADELRSDTSISAPPSLEPAAYVGCYEHPIFGRLELSTTGGEDLLARYHGIELGVEHLHHDEFVLSGIYTDHWKASFRATDGAVTAVTVALDASPSGRVFTRVAPSCSEDAPGAWIEGSGDAATSRGMRLFD